MATRDNARGGSAAGVSEDDVKDGASISRGAAREAQVLELARGDDWRSRVAALGLPEREARALRVAILRVRNFRSARLVRSGRTKA